MYVSVGPSPLRRGKFLMVFATGCLAMSFNSNYLQNGLMEF